MKIAVTGLSGLLGRTLLDTWQSKHELIDLYHTHPIKDDSIQHIPLDLLDEKSIAKTFKMVSPDVIIHMAAMTHIDRCEEDKPNAQNGVVWKINVDATRAIATYAANTGSHLVLLSTECVFDGEQTMYAEHAGKNPKNWYGRTKSAGEDAATLAGADLSIVRSVVAYRPVDTSTVFGKIVAAYKKGKRFPVVSDQFFMPTYAEDITWAIEQISNNHYKGIFHVVPPSPTTPLAFAVEIGKHFGFDISLVFGQTLQEYFGTKRAKLRLKHACLDARLTSKVLGKNARTLQDILRKLPQ